MGADPIACAALAGGADVKAFFVRKEAKAHGLSRRIEGPLLDPGERCMLVEDVVTTGGSTLRALEALRDEGHEVCGVLAICDRLAGGAARDRGGRRRPVRGADDDRRGLPGPPGPRVIRPRKLCTPRYVTVPNHVAGIRHRRGPQRVAPRGGFPDAGGAR